MVRVGLVESASSGNVESRGERSTLLGWGCGSVERLLGLEDERDGMDGRYSLIATVYK